MKLTIQHIFTLVLFAALFSCKPNPLKVNISDIKTEIEVIRFDNELFVITDSDTLNSITALSNKHPEFFDLFTYKVIQVGGIGDSLFVDGMKLFLTDTMILDVKKLVDAEFSNFWKTEKQLKKAFKYFQYHFPDKKLPTVFTCISGFNQSVFTAENLIGISLDKYLGRDCEYYRQLNSTPSYRIQNMHSGKIASDVAYAWGITEFEHTTKATTLLDNMIHEGKLMYFVDALLPEMHDSLKIGYTKLQLDWCKKNEPEMWSYLIEHKLLYSNKRMDIIRYINASPTTSGFPLESPGRTGVWIGWQIVRKYMKKFPETTLAELMQNNDYQQILNDSKYFPE
jgi:gliding motility-associated lipoprotein GldB